jgi:2-(1,2-epoxy-1,2-dihydrophenyl)acetyl-CoA isomerase
MTSTESVLLHTRNAVATITLNRPDAFNALDLAAKEGLLAALRSAADDPGVRAVLLTGTGRGFCVGQDLREFATASADSTPAEVFRTVAEHYMPACELLSTMDKPVVAAINGAAAGAGMSLALAADFRIAAQTATFTTAFTAIGLTPDTGMSWFLPRLVGPAKAAELLMLSPTLSAAQAAELGLVNSVVPADGLAAAARELAERLAEGPTVALAAIRRLLRASADQPLSACLRLEHECIVAAGGTADHAAALEAFLAKRQAVFSGR